MSRMRETVTTVSTTRDHESNLDALLEDLQTTVSRSNSHLNMDGGNMIGYRSVRRTTTRDGAPDGTTTEYHVEYLNPANPTHQVNESSYNSGNSTGHSYNKSYKYSAVENSTGAGDYRMKKNISELDSLLDDLNSAQRRNFSETSTVRSSSAHGLDSGLIDHATSTPHASRSVERRYREEKTIRGRSASPMRELVFTGSRSRDPSPIQHNTYYEQREQTPTVQQFYRYEKTTSTRTTGPTITDVTPLDPSSQYHPEERPLALKQRSPSPSHLHSYEHYSTMNRDVPPSPHYTERVVTYNRDADNDYPPRNKSYSYSTSSTMRETRSDAPKTPPPHRSPSPVSFQQPPLPKTPDPSHRLTYNVSPPHTVSSYKYSSTTNNHYDSHSTMPRPFPAVPSPTQNEQQPPKQLDELLASLGDPDPRNNRYMETRVVENRYQSNHHHQNHNGPSPAPAPAPVVEKTIEVNRVENEKVKEKGDTKNISGPPVYYPPGELFAKKEESMMMKQEGGGMYKSKGKYAYEAKSKSKVKESSGKAMVPVCLPVCCAMPCSIM
ncbi:proteoglycan 4 isoform X2 [Cimex lectularius]|uniref:Uncharacterized protein n=1 Tax=Cimex lectularius TaxID=79782 RepID=A0A8I6TEU3_CIMLE|nr:proteoglycan 4 isoform X2 [Cimex lectularius]